MPKGAESICLLNRNRPYGTKTSSGGRPRHAPQGRPPFSGQIYLAAGFLTLAVCLIRPFRRRMNSPAQQVSSLRDENPAPRPSPHRHPLTANCQLPTAIRQPPPATPHRPPLTANCPLLSKRRRVAARQTTYRTTRGMYARRACCALCPGMTNVVPPPWAARTGPVWRTRNTTVACLPPACRVTK